MVFEPVFILIGKLELSGLIEKAILRWRIMRLLVLRGLRMIC